MKELTATAVPPVSATATTVKVRKPRSSKEELLKTKAKTFVPAALKALARVATLADYNPTQEQRDKILNAVSGSFSAVQDAFETTEETVETEEFAI